MQDAIPTWIQVAPIEINGLLFFSAYFLAVLALIGFTSGKSGQEYSGF